ncbi:MAG: NAD(P)/FAD-dependent oxidoreductase [Gallicola sp.]|nr:NAD(P)/FAD-dependent oxidoreductase [Gallicola sp.]
MKNIIVIGAGASGMFCSLLLKEKGFDVTVLERNDKIMKKIYATGNGRCNFTNRNINISHFHGQNPKFAMTAIHQFTNEDAIAYFRKIGIPEIELEEGKIYPMSLQASSIPIRVEEYAKNLGIEIHLDTLVKEIEKKDHFIVTGDKGEKYYGDLVILAAGGRAMAKSGSDGNGYSLLKKFDIHMVETHPGIVQLKLHYPYLKRMDGTKVPGSCTLIVEGKRVRKEFSDILFTQYGISGPAVLQISSEAIRSLKKGKDVRLSIDILPLMEENILYYFLKTNFENNSFITVEKALVGLIHKNLIIPILRDLHIEKDKKAAELSNAEIHSIKDKLKNYMFTVTGEKSDKDGQITCGGVSTKEINPKTMELKKIKGLYCIGEIVDIDGDCGGYNLQWAWSSAYVCAMNIDL